MRRAMSLAGVPAPPAKDKPSPTTSKSTLTHDDVRRTMLDLPNTHELLLYDDAFYGGGKTSFLDDALKDLRDEFSRRMSESIERMFEDSRYAPYIVKDHTA